MEVSKEYGVFPRWDDCHGLAVPVRDCCTTRVLPELCPGRGFGGVTFKPLRPGRSSQLDLFFFLLDNTMSAATTTTAGVDPPFPPYVYKILSEEPPDPLPHTLPLTPLDKQDGFIHLSIGKRVPLTAAQFFASYTTLWVLRVDTKVARAEEAELKWGGTEGCVHMYARESVKWARLGQGVVVAVGKFEKDTGDDWEKALSRAVQDGWLA